MRFIRKEGSGGPLRRWLILALFIVIGSGIIVVQGRGGDDRVDHPPPVDLVEMVDDDVSELADAQDKPEDDDPGGHTNSDAEQRNDADRTEHIADATSPLQDLLTWPGIVGRWALVNEVFDTLAVPDVGYVAWELAAGEQRQAIHVVALDRESEFVQLRSELAGGRVAGIEPVVAVADRLTRSQDGGGAAIAAINADFFLGSPVLGQPVGIHVSDGELIVDPNGRPLFALFADGQAWIGEVESQATVERIVGGEAIAGFPLDAINRAAIPDGLTLYTPPYGRTIVPLPHADSTAVVLQALLGPLQAGSTHQAVVIRHVTGPGEVEIPAQGAVLVGRGRAAEFVHSLRAADRILFHLNFEPALTGVQQAVAGSHVLVWHGETVSLDLNDPLVSSRHPRTAIGYNDEAVFLVTVDGRQPGYASGMTLPELAELFVALGADAALNLDGGGSTTMAIRRSEDQPLAVVNRPSDGSPRAVGNALVLMSVEPLLDPVMYLEATDERLSTLLWGAPDGTSSNANWEVDTARATAELAFHEAPAPLPLPDAGDVPILQLTYDLTDGPPGTAAAYAQVVGGLPIIAEPRPEAIGLWVYGDGSDHWLRGHYVDATGQQHVLNFTLAGGLSWTGWRYVTAPIDPGAKLPLELQRIYVVETDDARRSAGVLYFGPVEVLH